MTRLIIAATVSLLGSSCSGSGTIQNPLPRTNGAGVATARPSFPTLHVTIVMTIPNLHRPPTVDKAWGYISPSTRSVAIQAYDTYYENVSPGSPNCKGGPDGSTVCTFTGIKTLRGAGRYFRIKCLDQPVGVLKNRHVVSYGEATFHIRREAQTLPPLFLNGVVASASASLSKYDFVASRPGSSTLTLTMKDADGNAIPSPERYYAAPRGEPGTISAYGVFVGVAQPNVGEPKGLAIFVNNHGEAGKTTAILNGSWQIASVKFFGRAAHDSIVTVRVPHRQFQFRVTVSPSIGRRLTVPATARSTALCQHSSDTLYLTDLANPDIYLLNIDNGSLRPVTIPSGHIANLLSCPWGSTTTTPAAFGSTASNSVGFLFGNLAIKEYMVPTASAGLSSVWMDYHPFLDLWFTERSAGKIGEADEAGGFRETNVGMGARPSAFYGDWFSDPATNAVASIRTYDLAIEQHLLPQSGSQPSDITTTDQTSDVSTWFTEANASRVGTITDGGELLEFDTPAALRHIVSGDDSWIYAIDANSNVEMIDPAGHVSVISNPVPGLSAVAIARGNKGNIWILSSNSTSSSIEELIY